VDPADRSEHSDGRRLAGAHTRRRLLDAAAEILASHGEPGLTLRAVGAVAGSNVATVKYHFGSRDGLVAEVITNATGSVVSAQLAALDALGDQAPSPSAQALIRAWATPLVRVAISRETGDRRLGRIIGQSLATPDGRLDHNIKDITAVPTQRLRDGLRDALPHLDPADLTLRVAFMVSALSGFASGAFDVFIVESDPARELETRVIERLIAIITV
jgi:AcrR family transcriptional regulator